MGIDILDINFRLEKRFKIRISRGIFAKFFEKRHPPDATAGQVAEMVLSMLPQLNLPGNPRDEIKQDCHACFAITTCEACAAKTIAPNVARESCWINRCGHASAPFWKPRWVSISVKSIPTHF
jgi:hypothetical protein